MADDFIYMSERESTEVKKLVEAKTEAEVQFKWPKPKFEPKFNQIY